VSRRRHRKTAQAIPPRRQSEWTPPGHRHCVKWAEEAPGYPPICFEVGSLYFPADEARIAEGSSTRAKETAGKKE